jgi:hypothetical protein
MKERPILFSAPMVRALLKGGKTQTRRVLKHQPPAPGVVFARTGQEYGISSAIWTGDPDRFVVTGSVGVVRDLTGVTTWYCPYGVPGDRLWVRETSWFDVRDRECVVIYDATPGYHKYKSVGRVQPCDPEITVDYLDKHEFWKRRPSIFMKRWMSRLTLEITSVRVERLNGIDEMDAFAEGIDYYSKDSPDGCPVREYKNLWESINGPDSWAKNPWVWVLEFNLLATL